MHSRLPWEFGEVPMAASQQRAAQRKLAILEQGFITRHACRLYDHGRLM